MHIRRDDKISVETDSVTLADLKIEGVEYQQLIDVDIFETVHQHGTCRLKFIMKEDFDAKTILSWNKTQIKVKADKDIIFCGIISKCVFDEQVGANYLTVTARTLSCQLESARKSQTFQDANKKFSTMLSEIEKDYSPAEITCANDDTVAEMIYRENLTDWEFLTELAESHGQVLFTDSKSDKLRISLGFKAFKEFESDDLKLLQQHVSIDVYKRLEANTYEGARACYFLETDFFTYDVTIGVGHGVNYDNQLQAVISSHVTVYEHVLQNKLTIRYAEGCRADAWDVVKYFDRFYYLTGKVLESTDTNVKVQFDCDEKQDKNAALDIPYESAVSNYLYTMPDVDDKVFVYVDHIRQAAMGSLRAKEVSDDYKNRSFKVKKDSALILEPTKMEFNAAEKTLIDEEDGIKFATPKDIIFSCKGDLIIQSAQGMVPDNQLTMAATHMAGYAQYLAGLGQPATVQFNPAGSTVGKVTSQITGSGSKAESVELSDIAKELDKLTGRQNKNSEESKSGGGGGGSIKLEAKNSALVQVSDSSIEMKGSNLNVKTPALMQVATIPMAGGGKGSGGIGGGNPKNRSEKINVEHGQEDRSRVKEEVTKTPDDKSISR
ncbi:MAG: hypothetical protein IKZ58_01785 [Selenomonadaceae bacterium]|nr:hypothetical protein [Selenomonadaceae bacterium]